MKKSIFRIITLILAALLLAGCGDMERIRNYFIEDFVAYEDMEYRRPDIQAVDAALAEAIEASKGNDLEKIVDLIYAYYDVYDDYYTNYSLADIRYCGDLTDIYWEKEYTFCLDNRACPA